MRRNWFFLQYLMSDGLFFANTNGKHRNENIQKVKNILTLNNYSSYVYKKIKKNEIIKNYKQTNQVQYLHMPCIKGMSENYEKF